MKNVLAAVALVSLLAGTAAAQQKQPKRTVNTKSSNGVSPMNDENGASKSAEEDKTNVPAGVGGTPSGTGLTNDQNQAASSSATTRPTQLDAKSSIRTGASDVKPKKKAPKPNN